MTESAIVTVWNGLEFTQMTASEAKKLVKADKAEIVNGQQLKYHYEFSGHKSKPAHQEKPKTPKEPKKNSFKNKTVEK